MSTYFFVIFEVHHMVFRYNVCLEKYMDLSPRLRYGTNIKRYKTYEKDMKEWKSKKIK